VVPGEMRGRVRRGSGVAVPGEEEGGAVGEDATDRRAQIDREREGKKDCRGGHSGLGWFPILG
jgi:hypothetical protein